MESPKQEVASANLHALLRRRVKEAGGDTVGVLSGVVQVERNTRVIRCLKMRWVQAVRV